MPEDIRDKFRLDHEDILALNFIRIPGKYYYRRHYRTGLRSHIMEVLNPQDVKKEVEGVTFNGLRWFPRARPLKMLRIFRTRFSGLKEAVEELERVKLVTAFLLPHYVARSNEFLVDYRLKGTMELLLCGLQDYVEGEILDPWGPLDYDHLVSLLRRMGLVKAHGSDKETGQWVQRIRQRGEEFVRRLKKMILKAGHVPDLAGVGNLLITRSGDIRLVDINNISRVAFEPIVTLDDRGYPACDKSIEALSLLERKLSGRPIDMAETLYRVYLDPGRRKEVMEAERRFHLTIEPGRSAYPMFQHDSRD